MQPLRRGPTRVSERPPAQRRRIQQAPIGRELSAGERGPAAERRHPRAGVRLDPVEARVGRRLEVALDGAVQGLVDERARGVGVGEAVGAVEGGVLPRIAALDEGEVGVGLAVDAERARQDRDPFAVVERLVERLLGVEPFAGEGLVLEGLQVVA